MTPQLHGLEWVLYAGKQMRAFVHVVPDCEYSGKGACLKSCDITPLSLYDRVMIV